ncbi:RDD family protein [Hypericibacter sp.]|uniref:RDD family protein n=1 Tax=Hypericibacter sp. TaxID=2705401 RepID=UPI003D6D8E92
MAQASVEQSGAVALRYGGFWRRAVAALIDSVIIGIVMSVIGMFLPIVENAGMSNISPSEQAAGIAAEVNLTTLGTAILLAGGWLYAALLESSPRQATFGKMALSLRVTDMEGERINFAQASGRFFAKLLSLMVFLIGFVMVAFTPRKQGLHDMLAKTLVIRRS